MIERPVRVLQGLYDPYRQRRWKRGIGLLQSHLAWRYDTLLTVGYWQAVCPHFNRPNDAKT
jgi:hypothetical protein